MSQQIIPFLALEGLEAPAMARSEAQNGKKEVAEFWMPRGNWGSGLAGTVSEGSSGLSSWASVDGRKRDLLAFGDITSGGLW